jgi:hypothetical protein
MPFDDFGFHGNQSFDGGGRFRAVCRRAAKALASAWPHGSAARRAEDALLRQTIEAAIVPELLRAARGLIESEEKWVKGRLRTRDRRFCAMGAIAQVSALGPGRRFKQPAAAHLRVVARRRGFPAVEKMNDSCTHPEILTAFDEAILLSERVAAERFGTPPTRGTRA